MGTHKKNVESEFSALSNKYDKWYQTPLGRYIDESERSAILKLLEVHNGEMILDVGTGTGIYLLEAVRLGAHVIGIDISVNMLNVLSKKIKHKKIYAQIDLLVADAENLPFRSNLFDKIICNTVLEFLLKPIQALKEFNRIITLDGKVVMGVLTSTSLWALKRRVNNLIVEDIWSKARFFSLRTLRKMSDQAGFIIEKARWSVFAPPNCPRILLHMYIWLEDKLNTLPVIRCLGAFLVVRLSKSSLEINLERNQ